MKNRYWVYPAGRGSKLLTGPQLVSGNIHPLRCVYLGQFSSESEAISAAKGSAMEANPETTVAHNVRIACDRRQTKRWRLSEQEIDLLIAGDTLEIGDSLGTFRVGYSRI